MQPAKRYQDFHGRNVRYRKNVNVHYPKKLILLGEVRAIEYLSDKFNGGGDGRKAIYRHEFTNGTTLLMDETGEKQLYIMGEDLKVTEAGIEN